MTEQSCCAYISRLGCVNVSVQESNRSIGLKKISDKRKIIGYCPHSSFTAGGQLTTMATIDIAQLEQGVVSSCMPNTCSSVCVPYQSIHPSSSRYAYIPQTRWLTGSVSKFALGRESGCRKSHKFQSNQTMHSNQLA